MNYSKKELVVLTIFCIMLLKEHLMSFLLTLRLSIYSSLASSSMLFEVSD